MSARHDIEQAYTIDERGIITSPGKFEGEMIYAPYFYEVVMEGGGMDEEGVDAPSVVNIDEQDRAMFPELGEARCVSLVETDDGFVYCRAY